MQFCIILHFRFFEVLQFQEFWKTQILNSCSFHNFTIQIFWSFAILKIVRFYNSSNLSNSEISKLALILWNFYISEFWQSRNPKITCMFFETQIIDLCNFHNSLETDNIAKPFILQLEPALRIVKLYLKTQIYRFLQFS